MLTQSLHGNELEKFLSPTVARVPKKACGSKLDHKTLIVFSVVSLNCIPLSYT